MTRLVFPTLLLTTQYLDEADQLTDRIAVVDNGRIIAEGTSGELKTQVGSSALHVRVARAEQRSAAMKLLSEVIVGEVSQGSDAFSFYTTLQEDAPIGDAMNSLRREGIQITDFSLGRPSLDEVFLSLTGSDADDQKHEQSKEEVRA